MVLKSSPRRSHPFGCRIAAFLVLVSVAGPVELAGQGLPIKGEVTGLTPFQCAAVSAPEPPTEEERGQARQLGSTARQTVILGDLTRARELLTRAVSLDGGAAGLAYQYGRVLEDLGETRAAVEQYCRALAFGAADDDAQDARNRIDSYADATRRRIPPEALEVFRAGVAAAGEGRMDDAERAFSTAQQLHSDFPEADYNRGIVLEALGRPAAAVEAYRSYLSQRPSAPDANPVSERIGQLQVVPTQSRSSGSALALGILLPGGGQFYTGRPLGGVVILALAGGAAAAGFLIEEVDVRCLNAVEPGQSCPPSEIIGETRTLPYRTYGLAGAGALMLAGALEAFFHARGSAGVELASVGGSTLRFGPTMSRGAGGVAVRLLRVTF